MHRRALAFCLAVSLSAGISALTLSGCSSSNPDEPKMAKSETKSESMAMGKPVVAEKDMTHELAADCMCGTEMGGPMNAGTLKKGTKVMLMMPGSNAQVMTADGKKLFVDGSKLRALGK